MDKPQLPKILKKLHLYLLLLSSLIGFGTYAQTFPISVSTQISQPSPIYLSHYADPTTINSPIKIQLVLNDLTISSRQVKLKIYFQGNGISFSTNDFVAGARPLYLEGGVPLQLTNVDLAPYFEYQNLLGLNPNQYAQPLPEGAYNIYVEVSDFATGKKLSKKTGTSTIIFQNEPPFLNLPLNNASFMQQNIQNIVFSWTPRSINVSNVEYEFSIVEIWDKYTPIQNAFAYSPPLYTTTTRNTTLQYGVSQPQLLPGKKYAWRIKAKAIFGAEEIGVFKNNGYSEIFSFDYESFCTAPLAITTSGVSENQAKITWSGNIDNYDYQVNYREKNADSEWYKLVTPRENITISNLKPNATYEYTVGASCDVGKYTHSTIKEFTTLVRDEIAFQGCGIKPDPNDLANKNPLPELYPNDIVTAGDFPIVVLHSTGSNGTFTGDGYVTLPFLEKFRKLIDAADALGGEKINIGQFSRIKITFTNIGVNTDFKLISGEIVASYDKDNWDKMLDADKIFNDVLGSNGKPIEGKISYEAKEAVLNPDGSTTIKGTNGESTVIQKSVYDQVYTDKNGNIVNIPANGSGEPTFIKGAEGGKSVAANTNGVSSSGEVTQISSPDVTITFEDAPTALYAFDELPKSGPEKLKATYETVPVKGGGTYAVNYKAVSDLNGPDKLIAEAEFKNGKTKDDIFFKTNTGAAVDVKWTSATKAEITVKRTLNFSKESILATVKGAKEKDPKDAAKTIDGKSDIAGKVNIWQLTQKPAINITLLIVNGASTPSQNDAKKFLNDVYNKVGITFDVTTQKVTIGSLPNEIQCGESGVFDVYTNDQNNIISAIESSTDFKYNDKTYYVIYTGKSGQNGYQGFMPLGGQYAFVFNNGSLKTAAHELGHGIFGLKHPFSTEAESGKTDLLMDYGDGTVLSHNDWDIIHSGGWKFYGFQKSSSGAQVDKEFILKEDGYFLTPSNKLIKLSKGTEIIFTCDQPQSINNGALFSFKTPDGVYWHSTLSPNKGVTETSFKGYFKATTDGWDKDKNTGSLISYSDSNFKYNSAGKYAVYIINMLSIDNQKKEYRILKQEMQLSTQQISATNTFTGNIVKLLYEGNNGLVEIITSTGCKVKPEEEIGSFITEIKSKGDKAVLKIYQNKVTGKYTVIAELTSSGNVKTKNQKEAIEKQISDLATQKINELGGLDSKKSTPLFETTDDGGSFYVKEMNGREWLGTICDLGSDVWENAALPENYWKQDDEGFKNSSIHLPPTLSGVSDGAIDLVSDYPQLIKLAYDVGTKEEVRTGIWTAVKNITPSSVYSMAEGAVKDKWDKYANSKPYVTSHEIGKDGVKVVSALMGASFITAGEDVLEGSVKKTGDKVKGAIKNKLDEIEKYFDSQEWTDRVKDRFAKYEKRAGDLGLSKADWEAKYRTLYKNREIGKLTEKEFQLLENGSPKTFKFNGEVRKVDNLIDGVAKEIKSGQLKSSEFIENQLRKDIEMLVDSKIPVTKIEWHLFDGADANMIKKLEVLRDTFGKDKFDFINYNNL